MADLNDLLAAAATSAPSTATANPAPVQSISATSARIQDQLSFLAPTKQNQIVDKMTGLTPESYYPLAVAADRGSNAGLASANPIEHDLRTMDQVSFMLKYGSEGQKILDRYNSAARDVTTQQSQSRGLGQILGDSADSAFTGLAATLGSLGALGTGLVAPKVGASIAQSLGNFQTTQQGFKSDVAQDHANMAAALDALNQRDNQAQFQKDVAAGPGKVETALNALDSAFGYKSADHATIAALQREGRNTLDTVGTALSDPTQFGEGAANAVGSLLATGPLSKVIGLGGKAISSLVPVGTKAAIGTSAAIDAATGTPSVARLLAAAAEKGSEYVPASLAIGAQEGAGAYQQTAADVMNTDLDTLAKQSPQFNQMVTGGMSPEDARATLANQSGTKAAAIQAPVGVATGALVAPFEAHPFKLGGVRTALQNVAKEAVEEGTQNATGQVAQNYAEQTTGVNPSQDLLDSVGQQLGQGALYGAAAAGHVAAPGVVLGAAVRAPLGAATLAGKGISAAVDAVTPGAKAGLSTAADATNAVKETATGLAGAAGSALKSGLSAVTPYVSKVANYFADRGSKIIAQNEKDSPVSDDTMSQAAQDIQNNAPSQADVVKQTVNETDLSQEDKDKANAYIDQASTVTELNPDQVAQWHPAVQSAIEGATNRFDAIQKMQSYVSDTTNPAADRLAVTAQLEQEKADIGRFVNETPAALDSLPADSPARQFASDIASFAKGIDATPGMARADRASTELISKASKILKPITDENINTPEGQANVQTLAGIAEVAPLHADPASVQTVLSHYAAGKVNLNDQQHKALLAAAALFNAAKEHSDTLKANGVNLSPQDLVAENVATEDSSNPFQKSALGHAKAIRSAYNSGDLDAARSSLLDFQKFAQSQQNKLSAINTHLTTAKPGVRSTVSYQTLSADADRGFKQSKEGVFVNPTSKSSVALARRVASEAKFLTDLHNHLSTAFPELKVDHLKQTQLDPRLANGSLDDVTREFKDGTRSSTKDANATQQEKTFDNVDVNPVSEKSTEGAAPNVTAKAEPVQAKEPESKQTVTNNVVAEKEVAKPEPVSQEEKVTPVEAPTKKGLAASYPELVTPENGGNKFVQAFRPAREVSEGTGPSNATQHDEPIAPIHADVRAAIQVLPAEASKGVAAVYDTAFKLATSLAQSLRDQLAAKLASSGMGAKFLAGEGKAAYAHRWLDGKLLNLTEVKDGKIQYNEQLLQAAALAGVQWFLGSGQMGLVLDAKHASDLTGVPENQVTTELENALKQGIGTTEALTGLANKIQSYWGVRPNNDAPIGYTKGIPLSMAGEVLRALMDNGAISLQKLWVDTSPAGGLITDTADLKESATVKSINRIVPLRFPKTDSIRKYPDMIEKSVLNNPEPTYYFGKDKPSAPQTQMRNEYVNNTEQQLDALQHEIDTPHYLNGTMAQLYSDLGRTDALRWFGAGDVDEKMWNVNHKASLDGVNMTIGAAYDEFENMLSAINAHAQEQGIDPTEVENHYGYNNTRVGRMHMLGKYNPQSTKFIREVMLPTRATLNLNDPSHMQAFELGLGQALGIKVHNLSFVDTHNQVNALLSGSLAPAVATFQDWIKGQKWGPLDRGEVENAFKAAGQDISPLALHALTEYARFQNATPEERGAFTTTKYLEADGMTNGPINAMALHTTGPFTADWIVNMRKGGLVIGGDATNTSSQIRTEQDSDDLYKATTNRFKDAISSMRQMFDQRNQGDMIDQQNHLIRVMDQFLPDLDIDDSGKLVVGRGVLKNPLTITIYGSGANGIAGKVMGTFVDKIYERMSDAAQRQVANKNLSDADAFFPNDPNAGAKWDEFNAHLDALTNQVALYSAKKQEFLIRDALPDSRKLMKREVFNTFTFSPDELNNIQTNVRTLFVTPMRSAISDVVGDSLEKSTTLIRQATQVQSIFMQHLFIKGVEDTLANKEKTDLDFKKDEFLSQKELDVVMASLQPLHPFINTGDQSFFVAGSQNSGVKASDFGRALDGSFRSAASVYGPANAGVAGIPFLNIGMGDGKMMQNISQDKTVTRTLKIFDGMNMPLDDIEHQSQVANQAVLDSWRGNPMRAVSDAYAPFIKALTKFDVDDIPEEMHNALAAALFGQGKTAADVDLDSIREKMQGLVNQLDEAALQVQARHNVLDQVNLSVDQMAAAGAPHVEEGKLQLHGTEEEIAAQLTIMYQEELNKLRGAKKEEVIAAAPVMKTEADAKTYTDSIKDQVDSFGSLDRNSGARVQSFTSINGIRSDLKGKIDPTQLGILSEIQRSMATKGYKIISGTPEQLSTFMANKGDVLPFDAFRPGMNGFTLPSSRRIYLVNPSAETMVHEMIHAATYDRVLSHYQGGDVSPVVKDAIGRIESMMNQFTDLDVTKESAATQQAYSDALTEIQKYTSATNQTAETKAGALNEFMAWALANKNLADLGKKTTVSSLAQMAKDVFQAIKQLVYGRKTVPVVPGTDMFSNLLFNTGVVMREQPTIQARMNDTTLFHNSNYGNNPRLADINTAFNNIITNFVKNTPVRAGETLPKAQKLSAQVKALRLTISAQAHGFPMSMQEATTFRLITTALATEADLDGNALARAQELYQHVTKELTVEHFMKTDPELDDPNDRYHAQEMYHTITGNYLTEVDGAGRTSLLPMFVGLATVNEDFRNILQKIDLPKDLKSTSDSRMDAVLENIGSTLMNSLSNRMSGGKTEGNVQASIDALTQQIMDVANDRESFLQQNPVGEAIDTVNTAVVEGVSRLSGQIIDKMDDVIANSPSKLKKSLANYAKIAASLATEERSNQVAESVVELMNRADIWKPFSDIVYDMVGRTNENAPVYDMIKSVRANIQQDRQNYREHVPGILGSKFSRQLTDGEWSTLHKALGRSDIAALRGPGGFINDDIMKMLGDQKTLDKHINDLETQLQAVDPAHWSLYQNKMQQLSKFMMTGTPGTNLLRNAHAITLLAGEKRTAKFVQKDAVFEKGIDHLTTLYALDRLSPTDKTSLLSLAQNESDGLKFATDYLVGQRVEEQRKAKSSAPGRINGFKGYIPTQQQSGVSLLVADDSRYQDLAEQSYLRVADYGGSSADGLKKRMGYYFAPVSSRTLFNQGIFQNVRQSVNGVDIGSGFSNAMMTAGRITDRAEVARITLNLARGESGNEPLLPVYDQKGKAVAYERSVDPQQLQRLNTNDNLAQMIGVWRGRQVEEAKAQKFNEALVDALHDRYQKDIAESNSNQKEYVDLFDPKFQAADPVIADAMRLMTPETRAYVKQVFGKNFYVSRDMLNDGLGYRSASVGDPFTGNSRWSPETQEYMKRVMIGMFGNKAYQYFTNAEKTLQNFIGDAKTLIVVKSVVVPITNMAGNVLQLVGRGMPIKHIIAGIPKKLSETNFYVKGRDAQIKLEAQLRASTDDVVATRKLSTQWQSIEDSFKRLSIYPLIQAGEFTAISDAASLGSEDVELTSGKLHSFMESQVDKLPDSVRNLGRYALVTKDTALFRGLQKSVEYGDFIGKALLYDDLTRRQGKSKEYALSRVTEEFVNYDRLPGRFRGYLESMGLLWFYNFKIRAAKVAMSMVRNNPVHSLMAAATPVPEMFGDVGTPLGDNFFSKLFTGGLSHSFGIGQVFHAPMMNPWIHITQ